MLPTQPIQQTLVEHPLCSGNSQECVWKGSHLWPFTSKFLFYSHRPPLTCLWVEWWGGGGGIPSLDSWSSKPDHWKQTTPPRVWVSDLGCLGLSLSSAVWLGRVSSPLCALVSSTMQRRQQQYVSQGGLKDHLCLVHSKCSINVAIITFLLRKPGSFYFLILF